MISEECRLAGRMMRVPDTGTRPEREQAQAAHRERVARQHALCPGGTWCDCACKTETSLVRLSVKAKPAK